MPAQPTPIIGREAELLLLRQMLRGDDAHLITLTGPAGVGKTRLACEVAALIAPQMDMVHYVDLQTVTDPNMVLPVIAAGLGLASGTSRDLKMHLKERLDGVAGLLVLDHFEHLVAAGPGIAQLLTECPTLRVLVCSRVLLRLRWEHLVPVAPLAVPPSGQILTVDALEMIPAVSLFLRHVRTARPDFAFTTSNAQTIAEICRRLEGIPLSLELAASHLRRLSPQGLLGRLERPLDVLLNGPRDLPLRQQSLRAAVGVDYALLTEREQDVARHLAVFRGGGSFAAAAVVQAETGDDLQIALETLAEHSLLTIEEAESGQLRFTMLDTIRNCLAEYLDAAGETDGAMSRLCGWLNDDVNRLLDASGRPVSPDALHRLQVEDRNLQGMLSWLHEQQQTDTALALASRLWRYWILNNTVTEGRFWLMDLLRDPDTTAGDDTRRRGTAAAGFLASHSGDFQRAGELLERAQSIDDAAWDPSAHAELLAELGYVRAMQGQWSRARASLNCALALLEGADAPLTHARILAGSARVAQEQHDWELAYALLGECYALTAGMNSAEHVEVLCMQAELALLTDDIMGATERYDEALSLARSNHLRVGESLALIGLADIAVDQLRPGDARRTYREALHLLDADAAWDRLIRILGGVAALSATTNSTAYLEWLITQTTSLRQHTGAALSTMRGAWVERHLSDMRPAGVRQAESASQTLRVTQVFEEVVRQLLVVLDHLPPTFSNRFLDLGQRTGSAGLSAREREVARYISDGFTNRQIAASLRIAERTVDSHVGNILRKLDLNSRTQIAAWEIRQALLPSAVPSFGEDADTACTPS